MTIIDWVLIAVIAISTVFSVWRGATREILSLTTWVIAAILAFRFHGVFAAVLSNYIESRVLSSLISALIIIVAIVILGTLVSILISKGIARIGLGPVDKVFGFAFGAIRGAAIIIIAVMMLQATEIPSESWWKDSTLLPYFQDMSGQISEWFDANGGKELKEKFSHYIKELTPSSTQPSTSDESKTAPVKATSVSSPVTQQAISQAKQAASKNSTTQGTSTKADPADPQPSDEGKGSTKVDPDTQKQP